MEKQWRLKRDAIKEPGEYPVNVLLVEKDVSKSGNEMLVVVFKTDDNKHARSFFTKNEYGQKAYANLKQACGLFNGELPQALVGKKLSLVCEWGKPTPDGTCFIEAKRYLSLTEKPEVEDSVFDW